MGMTFWMRRFALAYAIAFTAIAAGQWLLRGRTPAEAALHAAIWAGVAAAVYTGSAYYKSRRCALRQGALDPQ